MSEPRLFFFVFEDANHDQGTLLAAVDKIVGQIGDEIDELSKPAKDLSEAIGAFQDAAKDVEVPEEDSK